MAHNLHNSMEIHNRHDIDGGDWHVSETTQSVTPWQQMAVNQFGESYLPLVNGSAFDQEDAATVFQRHFGESLRDEGVFYLIVGTDSGLLYRHIKSQGNLRHSRFLFIEIAEVLTQLTGIDGEPHIGITVTGEENWLQVAAEMEIDKYALLKRVVLIRSLAVVHGHFNGYASLWQRISEQFESLVWSQVSHLGSHHFIDCQIRNLTENHIPVQCLKDTFQGKTAVLLAGGPSLNDLLPWVKQHRSELLVIAVSRISQTLIKEDIQPDICVSVDPSDFNTHVSREMLEFGDDTLLANMYHLVPALLASWRGRKVFIGRRYPWSSPREPENLSESTGATVTNTAMFIALEMGVTQIILGGVDFCFNQTGHTHAAGSTEHAMGSLPRLHEQRVQTNDGRLAGTTNAFLSSANTLDVQAQAAREIGCRLINPAPGAMRLVHIEHLPLDEIIFQPLERPAREILADSLPADDSETRIRFYQEILQEVDRELKELTSIQNLSQKALRLGRKLLDKGSREAEKHNKTVTRIENQLYGKHVGTTTFIKRFGLQRFAAILRPDEGDGTEYQHTSELYYQAFADTSRELIEILRQARRRILSRLEEEEPHPDILRLTEQWQRDRQAGRARQWLHSHPEQSRQLTEEQHRALQACREAFDASLETIGHVYKLRLEQYAGLDNVVNEARDAFRSQDADGLHRLRATLQAHKNADEATQYLQLVEGHLAELRGEAATAIDNYQKIPEGPARMEAAARLFALYSEAGDSARALEILQVLASSNPAYQPLYADMLHATGDTETAVETYTDYLLVHPDDLDSMMKLGQIFLDAGSAEGVDWTMRYILGKDPDHRGARQLVNSLTQTQVND